MACSLIWRLLRHRPFTRLHSADPSTPPWASASPSPSSSGLGIEPASNLNTENHAEISISVHIPFSDDGDHSLLLLNTMAGQGSPLIALRSTTFSPDHPFRGIPLPFFQSEGFLGLKEVRQGVSADGRTIYDWIYAFSTAANASLALLDHPRVDIAGIRYHLFPYEADSSDLTSGLSERANTRNSSALVPPALSDISPPRKRLKQDPPNNKIVCKICYSELDGAYSTPCRRCKEATCYDCVKSHFETALKYIDNMPAMCCSTVMHHDVARGILPEAEIEKYKQKYDEFNAINPLYCPVPTCSAFIPPRMFKQNDRTVTCHICNTVICTECKEIARDEHTCANDDSRQFILRAYDYKICPKCGTGIMKMFGCPHVRCQCGAHWCWDCQRPMNACYSKPCRAAREDDVQSEGDQESESDEENGNDSSTSLPVPTERGDSTQVQAPQDQVLLHSATNTAAETQDTSATPPAASESTVVEATENNEVGTQAPETAQLPSDPTVPEATANTQPQNLDDPDEADWEAASLDFGDEPTDETWDMWGCRHQFSEFGKDHIPEFWLVDMSPAGDRGLEVECMGCFNKVKVADGETKKTGFKEKWCNQTPFRTTEPSTSEDWVSGDRRTKSSGSKSQSSFECRLCGVIYCRACKKAARKRITRENVPPDSDPLLQDNGH